MDLLMGKGKPICNTILAISVPGIGQSWHFYGSLPIPVDGGA